MQIAAHSYAAARDVLIPFYCTASLDSTNTVPVVRPCVLSDELLNMICEYNKDFIDQMYYIADIYTNSSNLPGYERFSTFLTTERFAARVHMQPVCA